MRLQSKMLTQRILNLEDRVGYKNQKNSFIESFCMFRIVS